ncbi:alpha/beta fold hydrolase [Streptomyces lavendulae]|uniref:alpha/beta fold hydrolase n=1 Tax=Streptomyces lavendulae TaxID=1914 RepID=UPI0036A198AA
MGWTRPARYGRLRDAGGRVHVPRAALRRVTGEVLVLAGDLDGNPAPALAARLAALFPHGALDVLPGGGHYPWLDDPARFAGRVERFLATGT